MAHVAVADLLRTCALCVHMTLPEKRMAHVVASIKDVGDCVESSHSRGVLRPFLHAQCPAREWEIGATALCQILDVPICVLGSDIAYGRPRHLWND